MVCMELAVGFVWFVASTIAWLITESTASPSLDIVPDSNRFQGQSPGHPAHEFYHVRVLNVPASWPAPGRRPAWACSASCWYSAAATRDHRGCPRPLDLAARPLLPVVTRGRSAMSSILRGGCRRDGWMCTAVTRTWFVVVEFEGDRTALFSRTRATSSRDGGIQPGACRPVAIVLGC